MKQHKTWFDVLTIVFDELFLVQVRMLAFDDNTFLVYLYIVALGQWFSNFSSRWHPFKVHNFL